MKTKSSSARASDKGNYIKSPSPEEKSPDSPIFAQSQLPLKELIHVSEELICRIWHERRLRTPLAVTLGLSRQIPLQIVYPGRWSAGFGPDFQGALFSLENGPLIHGDVEIHCRTSDWWNHGHAQDPRYNEVALHVALILDEPRPAIKANGQTVPLLLLKDFLTAPLPELLQDPPANPLNALMDQPCLAVNQFMSLEKLLTILEEAGSNRFRDRTARAEAAFTVISPDQALYAGLLEGLGYSQNRQPMLALADLLPFAQLESLLDRLPLEAKQEVLTAILLGAAGLLPAQSASQTSYQNSVSSPNSANATGYELAEESSALWSVWSLYKAHLRLKPLEASLWQTARVRPANHPVRRLVAAAFLLSRLLSAGTSLATSCQQLLIGAASPSCLPACFTVAAPEHSFWATHFNFSGSTLGGTPALIGPDRAGELLLNVILPTLAALAFHTDDVVRANQTQQLYNLLPALADNEIIRKMTLQLLGADRPARERRQLTATARRQQGLLEIYQSLCRDVRCYECPVMQNRG